jgi:DNA-binding transcriptional LysR family regulator
LRKHGTPENLPALSQHRCSVFRHPTHGRLLPWHVRVGGDTQDWPVTPAFSTNDELLELHSVLAGEVIGQIAAPTAAPFLRNGRLIPVLTGHIADSFSLFIYYGSRNALPARVRHFIDLTVDRLSNNPEFVLSTDEINQLGNASM